MKKTLFVLLFSLSFFSSYGQEIPLDNFYVPGASWTHWWTKAELCLSHYFCFVTTGYRYTIERDTVVSGINYHLLSLKKLGSYSDCPLFCNYDSGPETIGTVFARIRVDSEKVYFIQDVQLSDLSQPNYIPLGMEQLLYDFRLHVGSVILADTFQDETVEVYRVDNLTLSIGASTKLYNTRTDTIFSYDQILIRGIGSALGFLPSYTDELLTGKRREDGMYEGQYSLCYASPSYSYHFDNGYISRADLAANCFHIDPLAADDVKPKREDIEIYPNPVTGGEINFSCRHANDVSSIQVADISGKLVYGVNEPFRNGVSKIPFYQKSGMYFVKIIFNDGTFTFRQISAQ